MCVLLKFDSRNDGSERVNEDFKEKKCVFLKLKNSTPEMMAVKGLNWELKIV